MDRQGFSFLVCPDSELIKDRISELLQNTGFTVKIFWGDEDLPAGYWQALTVPAMMGPPNAVVLRRAQDQDAEFWTRLGPVLAIARTAVWPVFCVENEWKSGKSSPPKTMTKGKFWEVAHKKGWIWENGGLSPATVGQELDRFALANGLRFASGVKNALASSLPLTTIAFRNELDKLLLLVGPAGEIRPEHLDIINSEDSFDIFAFLQSLQNPAGRRKVWERLLNDPAMSGGDMIFPISSLLVREARILWQLAHGDDARVNLYPRLKSEKNAWPSLSARPGSAVSGIWP